MYDDEIEALRECIERLEEEAKYWQTKHNELYKKYLTCIDPSAIMEI